MFACVAGFRPVPRLLETRWRPAGNLDVYSQLSCLVAPNQPVAKDRVVARGSARTTFPLGESRLVRWLRSRVGLAGRGSGRGLGSPETKAETTCRGPTERD